MVTGTLHKECKPAKNFAEENGCMQVDKVKRKEKVCDKMVKRQQG